jgi:hypothetical protein
MGFVGNVEKKNVRVNGLLHSAVGKLLPGLVNALKQGLVTTSCTPWRSGDFPVCDDALAAFQSDEAFG